MRWILEMEPGRGTYVGSDPHRSRLSGAYIEFETAVAAGSFGPAQISTLYVVLYQVNRSKKPLSIEVVANVDGLFDAALSPASAKNAAHYKILIEELSRARPTFGLLMRNTMNQRFTECCFEQLIDPDDETPKWFVATVLGNVEVADLESRLLAAMRLVQHTTFDLLLEWMGTPVDVQRVVNRQQSADYRSYAQNVLRWLDKNKSDVIKAAGAAISLV